MDSITGIKKISVFKHSSPKTLGLLPMPSINIYEFITIEITQKKRNHRICEIWKAKFTIVRIG